MDKGGDSALLHSESVPVPDPSTLTTATIQREVTALKELVFTRLNGMDKALDVFHESMTRTPTEIDKQITHLKELHNERFLGISVQFVERDTRTEQSARDSKVAVDAALQAAKEAVGEQNKSSALAIAKSEMATMKQIDQMGQLIQTANVATNDKIDDIKSRLTLIEGKGTGLNAGWGMLIGAAALAAALMSIFNVVKGVNGSVTGG